MHICNSTVDPELPFRLMFMNQSIVITLTLVFPQIQMINILWYWSDPKVNNSKPLLKYFQ